MSENEIKPVAWVDLECWRATNDAGESFFTDYQDEETVALYDQSSIDTLTKQVTELKTMLSIAEFQRKEMQEERDDLNSILMALQARHREVMAERDAAVADAERYRWLRDKCNHIGGGLHIQFSSNASEADAAIDAARAQERQG